MSFLFRVQLWLTALVLFVVYVLIITPVGLLSRLLARDPLRTSKDDWGKRERSAWEPRAPASPASYLRQY